MTNRVCQVAISLALLLATSLSSSSAFITPSIQDQRRSANCLICNRMAPFTVLSSSSTDEETTSKAAEGNAATSGPPAEEISIDDPHSELMYAMGINLGRQLGDVRPLVENGEELAQMARGLLDCVVGKLDEDEQKEILRKCGKDLDNLVLERA